MQLLEASKYILNYATTNSKQRCTYPVFRSCSFLSPFKFLTIKGVFAKKGLILTYILCKKIQITYFTTKKTKWLAIFVFSARKKIVFFLVSIILWFSYTAKRFSDPIFFNIFFFYFVRSQRVKAIFYCIFILM